MNMKKYYYIYKITFLKGSLKGTYYIGKHIGNNPDLVNDGYFGSGKICNDYYKKYPPVIGETVIKEILEVCESKEQLAKCEKKWIGDLWETDKNCVNLKRGGEGGWGQAWNKGRKIKPLSEEHKQKISEAHKGKSLSEESKRKLSENNKGKKLSLETKQKISEARKGTHLSEETRQKLSLLRKGKSSGMKGKKMSEETKQKISEAGKLYWQKKKAAKQAA